MEDDAHRGATSPDASVTPARVAEVEDVITRVQAWAARSPDVAVGLAGSWARRAARMHSDADLVVLCADPHRFERATDWIGDALGQDAPVIRTQWWGILLERRVVLPSGLDVEFGFAAPSWADVDPVDPGTARVVSDGFRSLYDPTGILGKLTEALR